MSNNATSMYQEMPEALTHRFEQIKWDDSIILKHRSVNLNVELQENGSGLVFLANLYTPLRRITSPKDGIEALSILDSQQVLLHLNGYEGQFEHYDEGVEFTYKFEIESAERLQRALRDFSFIPYKFVLDVDLGNYIDPKSKRFDGKMIMSRETSEVITGAVYAYLNRYNTENPTARIGAYGVSMRAYTSVEFESEDEQTLTKTEKDLRKIVNEAHERDDLELIVTRKVRK
ncbi:hypothetical protein HZA96_03890 [Candidatus Woesearchaeota archaeon]|nr:hypothetical protein [Candidatus Woesearchaeota archaeon]